MGRGPDGKDQRKFHKTHAEAAAYIKAKESKTIGSEAIYKRRAEIVHCLQRLTEVGATLNDATEFFLKHGAKKGDQVFAKVVAEFIAEKIQIGRKEKYVSAMKDRLEIFNTHVGKDKKLGDVTAEEIKKYIYVKRASLGAQTKTDYLRTLSVLFNFGITKQYLSINPCEAVPRPTIQYEAPAVLTPDDFRKLLNLCLNKKYFDRVAVFVLVGFCGVRVEEAMKLRWDNIDMDNGKVIVPATVAKKARFRRNVIPPNAMKWLSEAQDKRRKDLIFPTIEQGKRALNNVIRSTNITYSQNCLRHSFASYALEAGWQLADVVAYMGHAGSPAILHSNYRNVVEPADAKKWWSITPKAKGLKSSG